MSNKYRAEIPSSWSRSLYTFCTINKVTTIVRMPPLLADDAVRGTTLQHKTQRVSLGREGQPQGSLGSPHKLRTADCALMNHKKRGKRKKKQKRESQGEKRHTKNQSNNENKSWNNPSFHDDDRPNRKRYRVRGTSVNTPPFNLPHGHGGRGRDFENGEDFWSAHWWWREQPGNRRGVEVRTDS